MSPRAQLVTYGHERLGRYLCVCVERIQLQGFAAERKGEREEMQDAHVIIDDFSTFLNNGNQ